MVEVLVVAGICAVVAMMRIIAVIHMSVEVVAAMKPGTDADEDSAVEPLGAIVAEGRAVIRSEIVITVGTDWFHPNVDGNLGWCGRRAA
jgi:hypothetical protein